VLIPTAVDCCPSAARRRNPDPRTTIRIARSHQPSCRTGRVDHLWFLCTVGDRLVAADAHARPCGTDPRRTEGARFRRCLFAACGSPASATPSLLDLVLPPRWAL